MLQRIQTVFLVLIVTLMTLYLFFPIWIGTTDDSAVIHQIFGLFYYQKNQNTLVEIVEYLPTSKERILFVDDEEILATLAKTMLEKLGYHVTSKSSSLEALETFQRQPDTFDIVITDQTMPGMTGCDLSRRILQIRPDIPIILCTGFSSIISEEKAKAMGIKWFALKPLAQKDITKLIQKVLGAS